MYLSGRWPPPTLRLMRRCALALFASRGQQPTWRWRMWTKRCAAKHRCTVPSVRRRCLLAAGARVRRRASAPTCSAIAASGCASTTATTLRCARHVPPRLPRELIQCLIATRCCLPPIEQQPPVGISVACCWPGSRRQTNKTKIFIVFVSRCGVIWLTATLLCRAAARAHFRARL